MQTGLKPRGDVEAMEGCYLLACLAGLLSMLYYRTQNHSPGTKHPQWAVASPLITNGGNTLQLDLMEAFSQLRLLYLR